MTSPSLTVGSILLAYSPTASLLLLIVFQKPQLVILAVCSAFAYLLSALLSSVIWLITSSIDGAVNGDRSSGVGLGGGVGTLFALSIPGVACQMLLRCLFVSVYFRVEDVIRRSVAKHEEEERAAAEYRNGGAAASNNVGGSNAEQQQQQQQQNSPDDAHAETNALQLQLNDLSCSVASGCGYALLHALFLYGTLLASEGGESGSYNDGVYAGGGGSTGHGGTLYQSSCGGMPSLINGALIACMFSILDVMWMMLCFFGMRRRAQHGDNGGSPLNDDAAMPASHRGGAGTVMQSLVPGLTCRGLPDTATGGNAALLIVTITHLAASLVLAPNGGEDGCKISLPLLGVIVLWVGLMLRGVTSKGQFLPEDQLRRIQGMQLGLRHVDQGHHVE